MKTLSRVPEELVVEILSRVPAVSLVRFRSLSKGWNARIKGGIFLKKHSANVPTQSLPILLIDGRVYSLSVDLRGIQDKNVVPTAKVTGQFSLKDPVSSSSEEVRIRDVYHCDSLLLCSTEDNRLVVCNPCSGETRWIQPQTSYKSPYKIMQPKTSFKSSDFYVLGYDNKSSSYKILRMDQSFKLSMNRFFKTEYEVYDLSSNSWPSYGMGWANPPCQGRGIHVKGIAYWFALTLDRESAVLVSYNFSTHWFHDLSLPGGGDPRLYAHVALSATRDEQQLCMLSRSGAGAAETVLWMATRIESDKDLLWTKHLTLSGTDLRFQQRFTNGISFLVDQENKVVLSSNRPMVSENIIHIVGEDKYLEVDHHGAKPTQRAPTPILLSYVPSLSTKISSS